MGQHKKIITKINEKILLICHVISAQVYENFCFYKVLNHATNGSQVSKHAACMLPLPNYILISGL